MKFLDNVKEIAKNLEKVPKFWDGKKAILEMKEDGYRQWKQMEWIGFYFQYLCEINLKDIMKFSFIKYGNVTFDGFKIIPFDFKSHAINTSNHEIIVNDKEAVEKALDEYGEIGVILASGTVVYNDEDRSFQEWHSQIKGGESKYEKERKKRGAWSRIRKVSFDLEDISFIRITQATLDKCGSFQANFRNADGSPRRAKIKIDLDKIDNEIEHTIEF